MNKIILGAALIMTGYCVKAQPFKVTSAQTYIDAYNAKDGDINLEKAKSDIDEAAANEKTITWGKTWYLKGEIYEMIFENKTGLADKFKTVNLLEDSYDAYKKAIDLKDVKFRDQESVFNNMKVLSNHFINRGADQFQAQQYALAYQSFSKLEDMNNFFTANGQKFPHDISNVRSNAALCAQKAGMTKEAITLYEGVVSKGSDDANLYYTLSQLYKADGRDADAKKLLDDAVTKFPNNINLLISQLNYYLAENKHEEALEKLKKAISLDPKNDQLYVAAGIAFDKIKDTAQSREMYRKAIEVNPKNLNAWNNIGVTYVDEANVYIKQMNALGMTDADKVKYEDLKKKRDAAYKAAKPYLEKVLELDPTNEQVKRVMAKVNSSLTN